MWLNQNSCYFLNNPKVVPTLKLLINGNPIEQLSNFNFLGITIDQNITWSDHITKISIKVARVIGILSKLKHIFPRNILRNIYNSLIHLHLIYGLYLWGFSPKRLIILQKKAVRTFFLLNFVISVYNMIYNHYALKCAYIFLTLTWSALICNIIHQWIYNTKLTLLISTMARIKNMTNDVGLSSKYFYMYLILLSYYYSCFCVYYHIWILQALLINIICINSMRELTTATTTCIIIYNYD